MFNYFSKLIKGQPTTPFYGAYIGVYVLRNWQLVYSLLNFEDNVSLRARIRFIADYYEGYDSWDFFWGIILNAVITLGVLILSAALINISRVITGYSENNLAPLIYKLTGSKSIVTKERFEQLEAVKNTLEEKFENEKLARINSDNEVEKLKEEKSDWQFKKLTFTSDKIISNNKILEYEKLAQTLDKIKFTIHAKKGDVSSIHSMVNIDTPGKLFRGVWQYHWKDTAGGQGNEVFEIREEKQYWMEDKHIYNIEFFNVEDQSVTFERHPINGVPSIKCTLVWQDENRVTGSEGNRTVTYVKLTDENK
jgi:hypothetical protein